MEAIIRRLEQYLGEEDNFLVRLRVRFDLDPASVEEFLEIIAAIRRETANAPVIDKRIAYLLMEVVPTLMSFLGSAVINDQYALGKLIEEVNDRIMEIFRPSDGQEQPGTS